MKEVIQPQLDEQLRQKIITESFSSWLKQQIASIKIVSQINADVNVRLPQELLEQA